MKNIKMVLIAIFSLLILVTGCSTTSAKVEQPKYDYVSEHALFGIASYYGKRWHGRTTANGEKLNIYAMTAAHKTLPFNTIVKVTLVSTGKSIKVRINDRGPYVDDRIIDLTDKAAKRLGMYNQGIGEVQLEILKNP